MHYISFLRELWDALYFFLRELWDALHFVLRELWERFVGCTTFFFERVVGCTIDEAKVEVEELWYGGRPMCVLHTWFSSLPIYLGLRIFGLYI